MNKRIKDLAMQISNDYQSEEIVVVCILTGAVYFTVDLTNYINELNNIKDRYERNIKEAQTQTEMNILSGEYLDNTDKILNTFFMLVKFKFDNIYIAFYL